MNEAIIISQHPNDSSYDEILREAYLCKMLERGLANSDAGRFVSDEEIRLRIASWQYSIIGRDFTRN